MARPPQPDPFDALLSELFQSLASPRLPQGKPATAASATAPATSPTPAPATADAALLAAVAQNDAPAFLAALKDGANVNAGKGRPLQAAAENKNYPFMQELVIRGADIPLAVAGLKAAQEKLKVSIDAQQAAAIREHERILRTVVGNRRGVYGLQEVLEDLSRRHRNSAETQEFERHAATIRLLEEYHVIFFREIAPLENLRLQRRILEELLELKAGRAEKSLDKPKLAAPKKPPAPPEA